MSKRDKLLNKWRDNTPKDAPKEQVLALLKYFFPGRFEEKSGSHIVAWDKRLLNNPDYGPEGDFSIPVKSGQKVKGWYLKQFANTIQLLEDLEDEERS